MNNASKKKVPFLYYVRDGECKSNAEMPLSGQEFVGWLSASHILRNQASHHKDDVKASLAGLSKFMKSLKANEQIKQNDLLQFV